MREIEKYYTNNVDVSDDFFKNELLTKDDDYTRLMFIYHLIREEKYELATNELNKISVNSFFDSFKLMIEGLLDYYYKKDLSSISKLYNSAEKDNNNKWVRLELYHILKNSEPYKAWGFLEEALSIDENFNEAIFERVLHYDSITNCDEIIFEILRMPQTYLNSNILNTLAFAYYNCFQVDNAKKIIKASLEKGETSKAYYLIGVIENDEEQFEEALYWYDKSLNLEENQLDVLTSKGWVLFDLGKLNYAKEIFTKLLELEKSQEVYNQLIQFNFKIKDFEKVKELIESSKIINGENSMNDGYTILYNYLLRNDISDFVAAYNNKYSEIEINWLKDIIEGYGNEFQS